MLMFDHIAKEQPERIFMEHPVIFINMPLRGYEKVVSGFFFVDGEPSAFKQRGESGSPLIKDFAEPPDLGTERGNFTS